MRFQTVRDWSRTIEGQIVLTVISMIFLIVCGVAGTNIYATLVGNDWLQPLNIEQELQWGKLAGSTAIKPELRDRLLEQLREIHARKKHHSRVTRFFISRHYTSVSMASVLALVSAVMLFFISRKGWAEADVRLIAMFIVAAAAAAFFSAVPAVYKQDETVKENKRLYFEYKAMEGEIMTFFSMNQAQPADDNTQIIEFIKGLDQKMREMDDFAIGFDTTKIPRSLPISELKDTTASPAP